MLLNISPWVDDQFLQVLHVPASMHDIIKAIVGPCFMQLDVVNDQPGS